MQSLVHQNQWIAGRCFRLASLYAAGGLRQDMIRTPTSLGSRHAPLWSRRQCFAAMTTAFSTAPYHSVSAQQDVPLSLNKDDQDGADLVHAAEQWVATADAYRSSGALLLGQPLPNELLTARQRFEGAWLNAGLKERRNIGAKNLLRPLSLTVRSYRFQDYGSILQPNALRWADEMVAFYREMGDRRYLAEALLEKADTYLELSQVNHTDRVVFERIARDGDKLLQDCFDIAEPDQRPEVLRVWSRFYYNMARPASGRLSDPWNEQMLALADQRIDQALGLEPMVLKNLNQKARVVQRRALATLVAPRLEWSDKLWDIHGRFQAAWAAQSARLTRAQERISPLNVLADLTLTAVTYSLAISDADKRRSDAPLLLSTLDSVGVASQREAWGLVRNTDLARSYGFDTAYDLGRLFSLRAVLTGIMQTGRQYEDIDAAAEMLSVAREAATVPQLDAALKNIESSPEFVWLPEHARQRLLATLRGMSK
jgi:hypothetical protein